MNKYFKIVKDLHLYLGLFISPFVILFSFSAFIQNHNFTDWQENWQDWTFSVNEKVDRTVEFNSPASDKSRIDFAKDIINQINIKGEIANVFGDSILMYIPVTKPGYLISIKADLISGIASIHIIKTNFWKKMIWLHKMPGPHNANICGNWNHTKIWGWFVNVFVVCLFFSSITGIALWYKFKNERYIGLISLLIGFLSILTLIISLTV